MSMDNDLLKMNVVELRQKSLELKKRLVELRFDRATGKLMDSSQPRKLKKELARVMTRQSQLSAARG